MVDDVTGVAFGGYGYELIRNSANFYNFSYTLEVPKFKGTVQLPNGTFLGPIGQVASGQRDLLLVLGHTLERNAHLDFSTYMEVVELKFLTSHPRNQLHWEAIILIFSPHVWVLLFLSCVIMALIFCAFQKVPTVSAQRQDEAVIETLYQAAVKTLCPLLEQGIELCPNSLMQRLILFLWLVNCLTITNFYKSDFSASATLPAQEEIPQDFKQLVANPTFQINFMFVNAAGAAFFNNSQSAKYKSLRERFRWERNKLNCIKSVIFEKKAVCVGFDVIIEIETAKNLTLRTGLEPPYRYSVDTALTLHMNMGFGKGSKYTDSFNLIVGSLRDMGIIKKWKSDAFSIRRMQGIKWMGTEGASQSRDELKGEMDSQAESGVKPLEVENVFCALLLLFAGIFVATLMYCAEIAVWRFGTSSLQQRMLL